MHADRLMRTWSAKGHFCARENNELSTYLSLTAERYSQEIGTIPLERESDVKGVN